jgi:hypothetical protein
MNKTEVIQRFVEYCLPNRRAFKTKKAQESEQQRFSRKINKFKNELKELNEKLEKNKQYVMVWRRWRPSDIPSYITVDLAQRRYFLKVIHAKKMYYNFPWGGWYYLVIAEQNIKPIGGKCDLCCEKGAETLAFTEAIIRWTDEDYNEFEKQVRVCAYHALPGYKHYRIFKKTLEYARKGYGEYTCSDLKNIRTFVPESIPPWNIIRTEALMNAPELREVLDNNDNFWVEVKNPRPSAG